MDWVRLQLQSPRRQRFQQSPRLWGIVLLTMLLAVISSAQEITDYRPEVLKRLPLEQLVDIEITSVSRHPESLQAAASAIDVITADDIRRYGAVNLPDALRLATGLHVAQYDGHSWAISSRGFNTTTSNKMQVLMDGRSLYTPLYAGVFWDVQHTFMPDIEQIEVIRGPGATLWGANAVTGVINIRTKDAEDTQGWLTQLGGGEDRGFAGLRYGGKIGDDTYYRIYATTLNRDSLTQELRGLDARDEYGMTQGGFKLDSHLNAEDTLTIQGDVYTGRFGQVNGDDVEARGGNALLRWSREISSDESFQLQFYYDRTQRLLPDVLEERRNTYDLEFQHAFELSKRQNIIWGLNARASSDEISNLGGALAFLPEKETLYLVSGFIQDEISVLPELLTVTLGSKFEYNSFSGFEYQPSGRFALTPTKNHTFWGAVSRAVRTPSRIDQDIFVPNPEFGPSTLVGNRRFESEVLIAYELGYRARLRPNLTTDLALFYHDYSDLRSQERIGATATPTEFGNGFAGETYGAELDIQWQPSRWWQIGAGYTWMQKFLRPEAGSSDRTGATIEGNDPDHILVLRSSFDLPWDLELDATFRYVDQLPQPATPAYTTLDLRLAWLPREDLEIAIVGRDLLDEAHPEYRGRTVSREIGRSVYLMVTWSF
ncbi:iron complex outermembrane recepter protein [Prosthecobacter debontii]|uniref:Iron complex outermembrane recepter protein n=2 Tax=Prosthecobacter debontii TaxID=48467 RepID=A0A1T4YNH5_9BACT|nr:iron complex outermembrane recepter protein [Prosthecobacter debontii]